MFENEDDTDCPSTLSITDMDDQPLVAGSIEDKLFTINAEGYVELNQIHFTEGALF